MLGHIKAYHLATQGDAVQIHTMARMHLEDRMLRERRQPPKTVHCLFPFVSSVQNKANPETESTSVLAGQRGDGECSQRLWSFCLV